MKDETGHEEIGGSTDFGAAAASQQEATLTEEMQQLAQLDPELAAQLEQQVLTAEQQMSAEPQEAQQIELRLEQEAVKEIEPVDPQLAQQLAAEAGLTPSPSPSPSPSPAQPTPTPPSQQTEPAPVASPQLIDEQAAQLAAQDPQLANEISQQLQQANTEAIADPAKAGQIEEQFLTKEAQEVGRVDPQLGQELTNQEHGVDLTMNAQGEPEQGPAPTNQVMGDPNADAAQWTNQGANGYCGPNSVSMMLEASAGIHVTEQQIADWAIANGDMTHMPASEDSPNVPSIHYGMTPEQTANAINHWGEKDGVTAEVQQGNMSELESYLKGGREVMIFIDAQQIWHSPGTPDSDTPDHYVVVTGFDPTTDTVYINDPGVAYGKEEAIPLSEFESAWGASQDTMIVTEKAGEPGGDDAPTPGPVLLPVTIDASHIRAA